MPLLLDKFLTALGYPLGLGLAVLVLALILAWLGMRRVAWSAVAATVIMLWVASMPVTAMALLATLEDQYPARLVEDYPVVDVAVVLGGGIEQPSNRNPYPDLQLAADRVFHAYRILKSGKARKLLLSGGAVFAGAGAPTEADAMAGVLMSLGIDKSQLLLERQSRNTFENARNSAALFKAEGFSRGLLVTSASHMPRALATFRSAGLSLQPASTDVNSDNRDDVPFPLYAMPDAYSLYMTQAALKEWAGLLVYRWRGWA